MVSLRSCAFRSKENSQRILERATIRLARAVLEPSTDGSLLPWRHYFLKRSSKAWRASLERGGAGAAGPAVCA